MQSRLYKPKPFASNARALIARAVKFIDANKASLHAAWKILASVHFADAMLGRVLDALEKKSASQKRAAANNES